MKNKKIMIYILLILVLLPNHIRADKYKVVGDEQFPPYEYLDANQVYRGFNVDIIKAIGIVTDLEFEFYPMKWEDAYNSINTGEADIIQGMKVSKGRRENFLFTETILNNSQSIFVLNNNGNIKNLNDLKGRKIGLQKKDTVYSEVSDIEDIDIQEYDYFDTAIDDLLNEKVDAVIGNTLTINFICKEKDCIEAVKIVGDPLNEKKYAIAVDKNNIELLAKLNEGIYEIEKNGMYDSLYRKWFGTPIKNEKDHYEDLLRFTIVICLLLIALVIVKQNINQRLKKIIDKKTEEEKLLVNELRHYDKLQFMDKIISSIAHEIRNPMTSIKLYTNQMKDKVDNREFMLAAAEDIPEEIDRIDGLITEFMEYSSHKKPIIEKLNLKEELENSIKLVKLEMKHIDFQIDVNSNYYIEFNSSQFKQLVINILLNSKDAVKDREDPKIKIYTRDRGESIDIYFEDNGYGMDEEDILHIFEPFYTTKKFGNGVGMFVVKKIVDENRGSIRAKSLGRDMGMCVILGVKKVISNEE